MPQGPTGVGFTDVTAFQQQNVARTSPEPGTPPRPEGVVTSQTVRDFGAANGWDTNEIDAALSKIDVEGTGVLHADQFAQLAADMQDFEDQAMLTALYHEHLGRDTDPTGAAGWGAKIKELRAQGLGDAAIKQALTPYISHSPEYLRMHPPAKPAPVARGATPASGGSGPAGATAPAGGAAPPSATGKVPYINQFTDSLGNNASNCGPTSMAMIARAFGYGQDESNGQLIADLGAAGGTTIDGTGWAGIEAMAARMGQPVQQNPGDPSWIAAQLKQGKLVCANGDYFALPPHNAARTGEGGHYVAIVGLDEDGNFLVNDPADAGICPKAYTAAQITTFLQGNGNGGRAFAIGQEAP